MPIVAAMPVVERIADAIYLRLSLLEANWSQLLLVNEVTRPTTRNNDTVFDRQIIFRQAENIRVPELDCPGNPPAEARQVTFVIHCRINPSEKDSTPADRYCDLMLAEVRRVICSAGSQWYTMGGLASDSRFGDHVIVESDGGFDGMALPIAVIYRTPENDPYVVRA